MQRIKKEYTTREEVKLNWKWRS